MRQCYTCKKFLEETLFNKNIRKKDGLEYQCRDCQSRRGKVSYVQNRDKVLKRGRLRYRVDPERKLIKNRQWYANNKEHHHKLTREYYQNNKDFIREIRRKWRKSRPLASKHYAHKFTKGGSLTLSQLEQWWDKYGKVCMACGTEKDLTIDHVISKKNGGKHELDNIQVLCHSCNMKKWIKTIDYRNGKSPKI